LALGAARPRESSEVVVGEVVTIVGGVGVAVRGLRGKRCFRRVDTEYRGDNRDGGGVEEKRSASVGDESFSSSSMRVMLRHDRQERHLIVIATE
jgi:hypothetical protein